MSSRSQAASRPCILTLYRPRHGEGASHQAPDGEHQRHQARRKPGVCRAPRQLHARLRALPAVRFVRTRCSWADLRGCRIRGRSVRRPSTASTSRHLDDARRHAEEGPQRSRSGAHHRLRARATGGARCHVSAGAARGSDDGFDPARPPTLTEVRRKILEQTSVFRPKTSCRSLPS